MDSIESVAELRPDAMTRPHPDRFPPDRPDYDACLSAHGSAIAAGQPGYLDPATGLFVMTAAHLAGRPCCEQGCRHCPWIGGSA